MIGESVAIMAVILVAAAMSLRSRKKTLAQMFLPFLCVPAAFLIGEALRYTLRSMTGMPVAALRSLAVLVGALVGISLCLLVSRHFNERRSRMGYLVFCWVFLIALAFAYYLQITAY